MNFNVNQQAFLALLRAGLWEREVRLSQYNTVDFKDVYKLAEEQSVVGILAAGVEHVVDVNLPQDFSLSLVSSTFQLEHRNNAMNSFIANIVTKMRQADIYTILVKGQGIAQCYERPTWRTSGDIDFLLSIDNYEKAKSFLSPIATNVDPEVVWNLHQAMNIGPWLVELHGKMPTDISAKINAGIDNTIRKIFVNGEVRTWNNKNVTIYLPSVDNDVILVFTHFLQHFYIGGVGLRQICDWIRLLYTYRMTIDKEKLFDSLKKMGILSEWKTFASFAVEYLGAPEEVMPFYRQSRKNSIKAKKILSLIFLTGNMGHNIDESYRLRRSIIIRNLITFWRRSNGFMIRATIFPLQAPKYFFYYIFHQANTSVSSHFSASSLTRY